MKFDEIQDEKALELLADILDPLSTIFSDEKVMAEIKKKDKMKAVSFALKEHPKEIIAILAMLDGVPVEEYHCNMMTLPVKVLAIVNNKELVQYFLSQESSDAENSKNTSGSATANTGAGGQ